jgi:hypothetical protein
MQDHVMRLADKIASRLYLAINLEKLGFIDTESCKLYLFLHRNFIILEKFAQVFDKNECWHLKGTRSRM